MVYVGLITLDGWGDSSVFFRVGGGSYDRGQGSDLLCVCRVLLAIGNFLEKLKFTYVGYEISTECTFGPTMFCRRIKPNITF